METLLQELKRYVGWSADDEAALRGLHRGAAPHFATIAHVFYERILAHEGARQALVGGESRVGQLKVTLIAWMDRLLTGPWDEEYFEVRCRIGRVHVRIGLPQHYMFGAMNLVRNELESIVEDEVDDPELARRTHAAVGKILDLELAIMLHTYREDLIAQQKKNERLATFGQLVGSIGHELRNPLGVMESSLYILEQRAGKEEWAKKHLGRLGEQLRLANGIVTALLDMIRDRPLARGPVALGATLGSVLTALGPPAGVRVEVEGVDGLPSIDADATQMRQVLLNLVDNAIQAAAPSGLVRVSGRLDGGEVELAIEDSGPGVDPQIQRRLFEPLMSSKARGIGLGLSLVKRIVARHGGSVAYAPRPGHGARFVVRLPLKATDG